MRKVYLKVEMDLVIEVEEGIKIESVLDELQLSTECDNSEIIDYSVKTFDVIDSK
jgi:hypothetical protein